jgi:hypothetical protein
MYILTKDNFVFAGPNVWHPKLFASYIEDDFDLVVTLPVAAPVSGTDLGNGITCYDVTNVIIPEYNAKTQRLDGPFYSFANNVATQTFTVVDKSIEQVQSELLTTLADTRWTKENAGVDFVIQGQTVHLDTARNTKGAYLHAQQTAQGPIEWKFGNFWLTVTPAELYDVVQAVTAYVQETFIWEKTLQDQILASTTLAALDAFVVTLPVENPGIIPAAI